MQPNSFSVLVLLLFAKTCAAGIILKNTESKAAVEVEKAALDIITSCYGNQQYTIGVGGNVPGTLVRALAAERISIVLSAYTPKTGPLFYFLEKKSQPNIHKLQVFIMVISTYMEFLEICSKLYESIWWNNMASFIILYQSPTGCHYAERLLIAAWAVSVVNGNIICYDSQLGIQILGYNPYKSLAPKPWQITAILNVQIDDVAKYQSFTVFSRPYRKTKSMCKNSNIDKLKDLNKYPVEILALSWPQIEDVLGGVHSSYEHIIYRNIIDLAVFSTLIRALNGTIIKRVVPVPDKGNEIVLGIRDISYTHASLKHGLIGEISYPYYEYYQVIVTRHSGFKSQLQKILSVIDIQSHICNCIVLFIVLIFFTIFGRSLILATLNVIRIVCNTGFANIPQNTPSRVFLTGVLLFAVTMQGIYQGNLASILTNQISLQNVNTQDDLIDSVHTIYVKDTDELWFKEPIFEKRLILLNIRDLYLCLHQVISNSSIACVIDSTVAMGTCHDLYVSEPILSTFSVLIYRPNWQLASQSNFILRKLFEADLIVPLELRIKQMTLKELRIQRNMENQQDFRNITFADVRFAFNILGIGLVCASMTFVFEIFIDRIISKYRMRHNTVLPLSPQVVSGVETGVNPVTSGERHFPSNCSILRMLEHIESIDIESIDI